MDTRVVRICDVSSEDEAAWRRLSERAVEPNPFAELDFFRLAARHFDGYANARLVVAEEGGEFEGVLPIATFDRPRIPPRMVASTHADPASVSCLQTPLIGPRRVHDVVDALIGAVGAAAAHEGWPGIVRFDELGDDGPIADALRQVAKERKCPMFVRDTWQRAIVTRAGHWEDPITGERRRVIRKKHRRLEADAGAEIALVDRSTDPYASEAFLELEMSGWKSGDGGQAFARWPQIAAWFNDWYACLVETRRAAMLSLEVGSKTIAMHHYVRAGDGIFSFRMAFDEQYAKYSPGAMLLFQSLPFLRDSTDAAWIDTASSKGDDFFLGMLPERRRITRLFVGTGGALDKAAVRAMPAMTKLLSGSRGLVRRIHGGRASG